MQLLADLLARDQAAALVVPPKKIIRKAKLRLRGELESRHRLS